MTTGLYEPSEGARKGVLARTHRLNMERFEGMIADGALRARIEEWVEKFARHWRYCKPLPAADVLAQSIIDRARALSYKKAVCDRRTDGNPCADARQ